MKSSLSAEGVFGLLGSDHLPRCSVDALEIVSRSVFLIHPERAIMLADGLADFVEELNVQTVVYDLFDPVLGFLVALRLNERRIARGEERVLGVPTAFSREYRRSVFEPCYDRYVTGKRVLVMARYISSNTQVSNCARACNEIGAAAVFAAAIANFGRSPKQTGVQAIRSLLLY